MVQHYESLYHGRPDAVDATYRLPLTKIVISTWLRDVMRERFASDAEVLVTPVDPKLFHRVNVRRPEGPPRVLMLQHDYVWKGVDDGMEAVARVRAQGQTLHLVGFGVKPPAGRSAYDEFHVNLPQEELGRLYSGVDLYLCPSWDEGLGMPSMEAMACGLPTISTKLVGIPDLVIDGMTGLLVEPKNSGQLADAIVRLRDDPGLARRLAEGGRDWCNDRFDIRRSLEPLLNLYRNKLSIRSPSPRCSIDTITSLLNER